MSENVQRNGLFGGVAAILLVFALYFMDAKLIFNPLWGSINLIFVFPIFMTLAAIGDKKDNGGFLSFGKSFQSAWITGVIALFLLTIFNYLLLTLIDPSLIDLQIEAAKDSAIWMTEKFSGGQGVSDEQMAEMLAKVEEDTQSPSIGQSLLGFVFMGVLGAVPSLIIAAFVKKNEDPLAKLQANEEA